MHCYQRILFFPGHKPEYHMENLTVRILKLSFPILLAPSACLPRKESKVKFLNGLYFLSSDEIVLV